MNLVFRMATHPVTGTVRPPTMGWDYTHVFRPENLDNIRVVSHHGRIASTIGIYDTLSKTPRGVARVAGIYCVATHPDYRRFGLATATLAACHARMRETGRHAGLLSTPIHNWYRTLGWERAGRQYTFTIDRRNVTRLPATDGLDITDGWRPHREALRALHNQAPLGAPRDAEAFAMLAERKTPRMLVARRGGQVVAYTGGSETGVREYGGAARDVAALLGATLARVDSPDICSTDRTAGAGWHVEISVRTPAVMDGLSGLLLQLGIPHSLGYLGMMKLIDPAGLLATLGIHDVTVQSLGADGPFTEQWRVRYGGITLDLGECELVKLFFGPERWPGFAPDIFPLTFWHCQSDWG